MSAQGNDALVTAGLSRAKIRALRAVCDALADGLDLTALAEEPAETAHARLCAISGIGPWTADVFLLFCVGHADIFPAGDLALREAVRAAFSLEARPDIARVDAMARAWRPWRGVAARLFWAYYRTLRQGRDVLPL